MNYHQILETRILPRILRRKHIIKFNLREGHTSAGNVRDCFKDVPNDAILTVIEYEDGDKIILTFVEEVPETLKP